MTPSSVSRPAAILSPSSLAYRAMYHVGQGIRNAQFNIHFCCEDQIIMPDPRSN